MKKIYFTLIFTGIMLGSCSGFLDQDNRSNVPASQFYNTAEGYQSIVDATYSSLRVMYNTSPQLLVAGTDIYANGKAQGVVLGQYTFTADDGTIKNFYANCYKGIQLANSVISYGQTTEKTTTLQQYIDEARFIRAWYYFQLVQQFGAVSLNTTMFSSAIMGFSRTSIGDVYKFLISEFTYLASSDSHLLDRTGSGVERANKRVAAFYLAKVYLTRGWLDGTDYESQEDKIAESTDFSNAAKYALVAINGEVPSLSINNVFDVSKEENSEIFWSVQFSSASVANPGTDGSCQQAQFGSYQGGAEKPLNKAMDGTFAPALRLLQLYSRGDGRLQQTFMLEFHKNYFDYYSSPTTSPIIYYYSPAWATDADIAAWKANDPNGLKTGTVVSKSITNGGLSPLTGKPALYSDRRSQDFGTPCIKKFDDYTQASISNRSIYCSMHDGVVARLGEAYLIAAEAYLKMNDATDAANMINTLRKRPGTVLSGYETQMAVSPSDISIDFILDERARELAGEYHRWTDLKRTHKLVEYVTQYNEDGVTESAMKGPDGKYKTLRPIPQSAIDLNQSSITQNPGY